MSSVTPDFAQCYALCAQVSTGAVLVVEYCQALNYLNPGSAHAFEGLDCNGDLGDVTRKGDLASVQGWLEGLQERTYDAILSNRGMSEGVTGWIDVSGLLDLPKLKRTNAASFMFMPETLMKQSPEWQWYVHTLGCSFSSACDR